MAFPTNQLPLRTSPGLKRRSLKALPDRYVSLQVKPAPRNLLPHDSLARSAILAKDDALSLEEASAKFAVFDRHLIIELAPVDRWR